MTFFDSNNRPNFGAKALVNLVLWAFVGLCIEVFHGIRAGSITSIWPAEDAVRDIEHFLDIKLFGALFLSSFLAFGLFSLIGQQSRNEGVSGRAHAARLLVLEEWASVLLNFGSLSLLTALLARNPWLALASAACYALAFWLQPARHTD